MICFVIYGVNIYVSKHKFNSFEKNYDILMISWKFSAPADHNETDPNGSGSATLVGNYIRPWFPPKPTSPGSGSSTGGSWITMLTQGCKFFCLTEI